jgi:hypothetical protein
VRRLTFALLALASCSQHTSPPRVGGQATAVAAPRIEHCLFYTVGSRGPLCAYVLTEEQARHVSSSYVLRYENGHAVSAQRVNGRNDPDPDDNGDCDVSFRYDKDVLVEMTRRDVDGNIRGRRLSDETRVSLVDEWGRPQFLRDQDFNKLVVERDERGLARRERYFGPDERPARDDDGAYEARFERDAAGALLSSCNFDAQGQPMLDRFGVHCYRYKRNAFELVSERLTFDKQGKPIANLRGVVRAVHEYDAFGNSLRSHWTTVPDLPYPSCAQQHMYHGAFGEMLGADCLDEKGAPQYWLIGHTSWRLTLDESGHELEIRNYDADGAATRVELGYSRRELAHDAHGHSIETRYFLEDGSPGQTDGPAVIDSRYDAHGLLLESRYYDGQRSPMTKRGCYVRRWDYDAHRQPTSESCLDAEGQPRARWDGVAIERYTYDERGLLSKTQYFDLKDRPVDARDGYQTELPRYDGTGRKLGAKLLKADGSEVKLPRLRTLGVRFNYSKVGIHSESRDKAFERIRAARAAILAGQPFEEVLMRYAETVPPLRDPGDIGYNNTEGFYQAAKVALRGLKLHELSEIVELPSGFVIYQRTE